MIKNVITGIGGFVASHLVDLILEKGEQVYGTARWTDDMSNIRHIRDSIIVCPMDLNDLSSCIKVMEEVRPNYVFHLAAQSFPNESFVYPKVTMETNIIGTLNLLEAIRMVRDRSDDFDPVVHVCSSSEVYGLVTEDLVPIKENCRFNPANPYGVGKVGTDMVGLMYYTNYGVKTIRTRMFTHSISYDSPIIVRDENGMIDCVPISDIRKARDTSREEMWSGKNINLDIWDGQQFTKILNISAHRLNDHKLLKFATSKSIVDVTDNHSIYNSEDSLVSAGDMSLGDRLAVRDLPIAGGDIVSISSEFAWLLGFLVAEGSIKESRKVCFSNADANIISKTEQFIKEAWCKSSSIYKDERINTLTVLDGAELATLFDKHSSVFGVYTRCKSKSTNKRFKKVPKIIMNSSVDIQRSFLDGYNEGDGRKNSNLKSEYQEFKTNSQCLASGLCFLVQRTTGQDYTLNFEQRELLNKKTSYYYSINLRSNSGDPRMLTGQHFRKERDVIKKIAIISESASDFVYDIETDSHTFSCGIGSVKVHNTGPRRKMLSAEVNFAQQIAKIEAGKQEPVLKHGNLDSIRTWADVRDAVKAYYVLVRKCVPGEVYNIGGDTTKTIGEMLHCLLSLSPIGDSIKLEQDPNLLRPYDVTLQIPDCSKFKSKTGWEPTIGFETLMQDLLDWNRYILEQITEVGSNV